MKNNYLKEIEEIKNMDYESKTEIKNFLQNENCNNISFIKIIIFIVKHKLNIFKKNLKKEKIIKNNDLIVKVSLIKNKTNKKIITNNHIFNISYFEYLVSIKITCYKYNLNNEIKNSFYKYKEANNYYNLIINKILNKSKKQILDEFINIKRNKIHY